MATGLYGARPQGPNPDLIVRYLAADAEAEGRQEPAAYAVIYVRPETNKLVYERAIASAVRRRGAAAVYLANINGALFIRDGILEDHYASQLRFARDPCGEMQRYPEICRRFEAHFEVPWERAPLVGSFDAARLLGLDEEQLFRSFAPPGDFLDCWGQEFKRVRQFIVANPNLPAILSRYSERANIFTLAVRQRPAPADFFTALNRSIHEEIASSAETPLLDAGSLDSLEWQQRLRRTYHLSRGHLMAMFDMADLVYVSERERLDITETPLGRRLLAASVLTPQRLRALRRSPLVYVETEQGRQLVYLPEYGQGRSEGEIQTALRRLAP